jgi:hypothetical protein
MKSFAISAEIASGVKRAADPMAPLKLQGLRHQIEQMDVAASPELAIWQPRLRLCGDCQMLDLRHMVGLAVLTPEQVTAATLSLLFGSKWQRA